MSPTWDATEQAELPRPGALGNLVFFARLVPMGIVTFGSLGLLLVVRVFERPIFGSGRPVTPWITQAVCIVNLRIMGIRRTVIGRPMTRKGALVANHLSWIDIFTLNALSRIYFVAKDEVAEWPGIGWLARATGTMFIARRATAAGSQKQAFLDRLKKGHRLMVFPEGTTTDGLRVLDFKSTTFAAFFDDGHVEDLWIQPVTQIYTAPEGRDPRFYGWWGAADFGPHFRAVLAQRRQGAVHVIFHDPVRVADFPDRKALADRLGAIVRRGFESRQAIASA